MSSAHLRGGKMRGRAETSSSHRQSTCLIQEIHCEFNRVIDKGDCCVGSVEYQG